MRATGQSAMPGIPSAAQPPEVPDHELLCLIGHGSYGEVWLARNAIGMLRAVKIVHRESFQHADHFAREFKGLLKFEPISRSHDGLVDVLQIGRRDDEGYFFYVMELADDGSQRPEVRNQKPNSKCGESGFRPLPSDFQFYQPRTLLSLLHSNSQPSTLNPQPATVCLPPSECIALGLKLAAALEYLHANGLVHRDVKPSNIIFVAGEPKLADIGLVTAIAEAHSLVGTVGYIPPEGPGTAQADLYSLGKVLYEIAFGKDRQEFPQLPADLQSHPDYAALLELNEVILQACETDPHRRYASATALGEDLARLQQGRSVKRRRTTERRWGLVKRYGRAATAAALVLAGVWLLASRFDVAKIHPPDPPPSPSSAPVAIKAIAVLPFDNDSPDKADDYLGTQLAEELSSTLTKIPELRLLGRDSAASLKKTKDRRAAVQELKVSALLAGVVRKTGNQLRLTAQLVNAADNSLLWSEIYDRDMSEFFGIQTDIAEKLAEKLRLKLTDTVQASLARKPTKNLEAYHCYLEGRDFLYNRGGLTSALAAFQEASRLDTNFALAYAGLAEVYTHHNAVEGLKLASGECLSNALVLAELAVRLDVRCAEAHIALADVSYRFFDWEAAGKEYALAIRLNPTHAVLHRKYAHLLMELGRFEEAIVAGQLAKQLDPWSRTIREQLGWFFFNARQYERARKEFEDLVTLDPNYGGGWDGLGSCYEVAGNGDKASSAWEEAHRLWGWKPDRIDALVQAYKSGGLKGYHQKELEQMLNAANGGGFVDSFWIAIGYAETGQNDQAFQWLERAYEERFPWMGTVAIEYRLNSLHSDPRFAALLKKMGLELPVWKQ